MGSLIRLILATIVMILLEHHLSDIHTIVATAATFVLKASILLAFVGLVLKMLTGLGAMVVSSRMA